jgi:cytochrome c biogenesis protein CcmG, thiol:disulfide interchange protein DsbE
MRRPRGATVAGALVLVALLVVAAGFAISLTRDPNRVTSVLIGRPAPSFTLQTLDQKGSVSLDELRGRVVVLNFFASWCAECRREEPVLDAISSDYASQGVQLLGVAFQDDRGQAEAFARGQGAGWPLLYDPDSETALRYGVTGLPETFVIARDGTVLAKYVGPVHDGSLRRLLGGSGP